MPDLCTAALQFLLLNLNIMLLFDKQADKGSSDYVPQPAVHNTHLYPSWITSNQYDSWSGLTRNSPREIFVSILLSLIPFQIKKTNKLKVPQSAIKS